MTDQVPAPRVSAGRRDPLFTYSGRPFFPLDPDPADVRIADIAHALSLLCRFAGHTRVFYSVAQHSLIVSRLCDAEPTVALYALLHDAAEAYLSDVVRPVKHAPELKAYRELEDRVMAAVHAAFGLDHCYLGDVFVADDQVLEVELRVLTNAPMESGALPEFSIRPISPRAAEAQFLWRFEELQRRRAR